MIPGCIARFRTPRPVFLIYIRQKKMYKEMGERLGGMPVLLLLDALAHLLVDAMCASTVLGPLGASAGLPTLILLYNTLAFSTQCLVGVAADRLRRHGIFAVAALLTVAAGAMLPLPTVLRVCVLGLGNSVFHVAAGARTLERSGGKAGPLGVFVAPGAVGLALGMLFPSLRPVFAALAALTAAALIPAARGRSAEAPAPEARPVPVSDIVLLTAAVAVRAVGGSVVRFPWQTTASLSLLTVAFVFMGKALGGALCDRLGPVKTALFSVVPAGLLIAFGSGFMAPSLLGQFALNLTMPVTLWLLYRAMPDSPGFAFGVAASALWPGTIAGGLIRLTGPIQWIFVLACFLFGLWAIVKTAKRKETAP